MHKLSALTDPMHADVRMQWGVKVPLRDGVHLNATLYLPENRKLPSPTLFTLIPYVGQTCHDHALYFAARGYPFLTVDARGRGNSEGIFEPNINEARDGHDVVEWLAQQSYCNGQVAMWGGSYAGLNQWSTAAQGPRRLSTIVPAASVYIGLDFPMLNNIPWPYLMQWLVLTAGRTSQAKIFEDHLLWSRLFQQSFESAVPFKELDTFVGHPSAVFQGWLAHPHQDAYWDRYNPTAAQYARIVLPILTITGQYDNAQRGALTHYREHLKNTTAEGRAQHYLVIGPWDHAGTRVPTTEVAGLKFDAASLIDLQRLHLEWYDWALRGGSKPAFLQQQVAYYVTGAERWRYAETLEAITTESQPFYLDSEGTACRIFSSGVLSAEPGRGGEDVYVYDPCDTSLAAVEAAGAGPLAVRPHFSTDNLIDQTIIFAKEGRQLIYHSAPFEEDREISGFFRLQVWLSIDQADTDFLVSVYALDAAGGSILLANDVMRARYRESLREPKLIRTTQPLRYDFERFNFVSRQMRRGHRLRLILGPIDSIYWQKNYNSGGVVAEESMRDARPVTVKLFHDHAHPSVLYVPIGQKEA